MNNFNTKAVKIGNQIWMAENLAIDDGGEGIYFNEKSGEYYYAWCAAMRVAASIRGWHLPTDNEWFELCLTIGGEPSHPQGKNFPKIGKKLRGVEWRGTDIYGFNAKPAGVFTASYGMVGIGAFFWTATEDNITTARAISIGNGSSVDGCEALKEAARSVRLVKDSA